MQLLSCVRKTPLEALQDLVSLLLIVCTVKSRYTRQGLDSAWFPLERGKQHRTKTRSVRAPLPEQTPQQMACLFACCRTRNFVRRSVWRPRPETISLTGRRRRVGGTPAWRCAVASPAARDGRTRAWRGGRPGKPLSSARVCPDGVGGGRRATSTGRPWTWSAGDACAGAANGPALAH